MRVARPWALSLLLFVVPLACGETTPAAELRAKIAEGCAINSDCNSPLVCAFRTCHIECQTSRDCERNGPTSRCVQGEKPYRVCQNEKEQKCVRHSECPGQQVCGVDGQCRDACADDRDCGTTQKCVSTTCVEPAELGPGGKLTPKPETGAIVSCARSSECPGALVCIDHACKEECLGDKDCENGFRCEATRCVAPSNGGGGRGGTGGQTAAGAGGNGAAGKNEPGGQGGGGATAGAAGTAGSAGTQQGSGNTGGSTDPGGAGGTAGMATGTSGMGGTEAGKGGTAAGADGTGAGAGGAPAGAAGTTAGVGGSEVGKGGAAGSTAGSGGNEAGGSGVAGSEQGGFGGDVGGAGGGSAGSGPGGSCLCADPGDACDATNKCAQKGVTCSVLDDCGPTHSCSPEGRCVCDDELHPTCGRACTKSPDCPQDYVCDAGTGRCKQPHRPLGCLAHEYCPAGTVCLSRVCTPSLGLKTGAACQTHDQCASGVCLGVCLDRCWVESDCPKGHCASIATLESPGSSLPGTTRACIGDPPCSACAAGEYCRMNSLQSGDCRPPGCRVTGDCGIGSNCSPFGGRESENQCGPSFPTQCGPNEISLSACTLPTACYLDDPATCPSGYTCSANARFAGTVDQGGCVANE